MRIFVAIVALCLVAVLAFALYQKDYVKAQFKLWFLSFPLEARQTRQRRRVR